MIKQEPRIKREVKKEQPQMMKKEQVLKKKEEKKETKEKSTEKKGGPEKNTQVTTPPEFHFDFSKHVINIQEEFAVLANNNVVYEMKKPLLFELLRMLRKAKSEKKYIPLKQAEAESKLLLTKTTKKPELQAQLLQFYMNVDFFQLQSQYETFLHKTLTNWFADSKISNQEKEKFLSQKQVTWYMRNELLPSHLRYNNANEKTTQELTQQVANHYRLNNHKIHLPSHAYDRRLSNNHSASSSLPSSSALPSGSSSHSSPSSSSSSSSASSEKTSVTSSSKKSSSVVHLPPSYQMQ